MSSNAAGRWTAVDAALDALLEHPESERAARLAEFRARDAALASEVERLLAMRPAIHAQHFLEGVAGSLLATGALHDGEAETLPSPTGSDARLAAGATFGPYRLIRVLGRGGMGIVYEADEVESGRRVGPHDPAGRARRLRGRGRRPPARLEAGDRRPPAPARVAADAAARQSAGLALSHPHHARDTPALAGGRARCTPGTPSRPSTAGRWPAPARLGFDIVAVDGCPASRLRVLARTAIAWSPMLAALGVALVSGALAWLAPPNQIRTIALAVGPVFLAAGAVAAIVRPERGIQDRLAGTWIVPR